MKKAKLLPCPFCGEKPTGKHLCSTNHGQTMVCDHCLSHGPPALGLNGDFLGMNEKKLWRKAIKAWNARVLDLNSFRKGIRAAAAFVEGFDKYVKHEYRLSDCILGKFNQIGKRKIRKNVHQSTEK